MHTGAGGGPNCVHRLEVTSAVRQVVLRRAPMCPCRLFVKLMLDYLNEVAYPAQQVG